MVLETLNLSKHTHIYIYINVYTSSTIICITFNYIIVTYILYNFNYISFNFIINKTIYKKKFM